MGKTGDIKQGLCDLAIARARVCHTVSWSEEPLLEEQTIKRISFATSHSLQDTEKR
jgi:hypothetical protein